MPSVCSPYALVPRNISHPQILPSRSLKGEGTRTFFFKVKLSLSGHILRIINMIIYSSETVTVVLIVLAFLQSWWLLNCGSHLSPKANWWQSDVVYVKKTLALWQIRTLLNLFHWSLYLNDLRPDKCRVALIGQVKDLELTCSPTNAHFKRTNDA